MKFSIKLYRIFEWVFEHRKVMVGEIVMVLVSNHADYIMINFGYLMYYYVRVSMIMKFNTYQVLGIHGNFEDKDYQLTRSALRVA